MFKVILELRSKFEASLSYLKPFSKERSKKVSLNSPCKSIPKRGCHTFMSIDNTIFWHNGSVLN